MSYEHVKRYFEERGLGDRVRNLAQSSATVEEAALAIGCQPKQIAKTMSFYAEGKPILVVMAGDAKVNNKKYKEQFHVKAKMIPWAEVEQSVGHAPGGVCPFVLHEDVPVFLDISLKRFNTIYPAAGSDHSAVELSVPELELHTAVSKWVDVCDEWFVNN